MLVLEDLSDGHAAVKIPVVNTVDGQPFEEEFLYVDEYVDKEGFEQTHLDGCNCVGKCVRGKCPCIDKSTIKITDHRIDVRKGHPNFHKDILYECSAKTCKGCKGECSQRLTPNKFNLDVQLYKTLNAGWAVRSRQPIEIGEFIDEFVGEVLKTKLQERRPQDYAYDLPLCKVNKKIYIDPYVYGNLTRFFNHNCFPNMNPFRYYSYHRDPDRICLGFYASRDIIPGDELTIDYGEEWWLRKIKAAQKEGTNFYCCCDWVFCINPEPGKPQMNAEAAKREAERRTMRNHKIVMGHKECVKRAQHQREMKRRVAQRKRSREAAFVSADDSEEEDGEEGNPSGSMQQLGQDRGENIPDNTHEQMEEELPMDG